MILEMIQFELFLIALDCFYWGGVRGYTYIIWRMPWGE